MKNYLILILMSALLFIGCTAPMQTSVTVRENVAAAPAAGQTEETYQVFYDELTPYGRWINYPAYGYVWVPNVAAGFQPYSTNGHWVYSSSGWTWVSNYNWGWAAFHYGRWFFEDGYGWVWVPGHEWAPAWVTWGHYNGYYGWAPLGVKINIGDAWTPPAHYWSFVPQEHMTKPNVENYVVDRNTNVNIVKNVTIINNHNTTIINNNTTVINNNRNTTVYNMGPRADEVEKVTNTHIAPVTIAEHPKPAPSTVTNNTINMYRPKVMQEQRQQQLPNNKPAPKAAEPYKQRKQP
jgi:hypothetical protein